MKGLVWFVALVFIIALTAKVITCLNSGERKTIDYEMSDTIRNLDYKRTI